MSTPARKARLTPEEYLAIERAAEFKSEFYDGQMDAMSGASYEHSLINANLLANLGNQLRGGPCRALVNDLRTALTQGNYAYPDLVVVCGKPQFIDDQFDTVTNPSVIIEVLSPSTQKWDRGGKFAHYQRIATLQHYVLIGQDAPTVERRDRQTDGSWLATEIAWRDGVLTLDSIGAAVPLREVYLDVFPYEQSV